MPRLNFFRIPLRPLTWLVVTCLCTGSLAFAAGLGGARQWFTRPQPAEPAPRSSASPEHTANESVAPPTPTPATTRPGVVQSVRVTNRAQRPVEDERPVPKGTTPRTDRARIGQPALPWSRSASTRQPASTTRRNSQPAPSSDPFLNEPSPGLAAAPPAVTRWKRDWPGERPAAEERATVATEKPQAPPVVAAGARVEFQPPPRRELETESSQTVGDQPAPEPTPNPVQMERPRAELPPVAPRTDPAQAERLARVNRHLQETSPRARGTTPPQTRDLAAIGRARVAPPPLVAPGTSPSTLFDDPPVNDRPESVTQRPADPRGAADSAERPARGPRSEPVSGAYRLERQATLADIQRRREANHPEVELLPAPQEGPVTPAPEPAARRLAAATAPQTPSAPAATGRTTPAVGARTASTADTRPVMVEATLGLPREAESDTAPSRPAAGTPSATDHTHLASQAPRAATAERPLPAVPRDSLRGQIPRITREESQRRFREAGETAAEDRGEGVASNSARSLPVPDPAARTWPVKSLSPAPPPVEAGSEDPLAALSAPAERSDTQASPVLSDQPAATAVGPLSSSPEAAPRPAYTGPVIRPAQLDRQPEREPQPAVTSKTSYARLESRVSANAGRLEVPHAALPATGQTANAEAPEAPDRALPHPADTHAATANRPASSGSGPSLGVSPPIPAPPASSPTPLSGPGPRSAPAHMSAVETGFAGGPALVPSGGPALTPPAASRPGSNGNVPPAHKPPARSVEVALGSIEFGDTDSGERLVPPPIDLPPLEDAPAPPPLLGPGEVYPLAAGGPRLSPGQPETVSLSEHRRSATPSAPQGWLARIAPRVQRAAWGGFCAGLLGMAGLTLWQVLQRRHYRVKST